MTEIEFLVRIADKLLPGRPQECLLFLHRAADATVDSRLRTLLRFAIQALESDEPKLKVACCWVDRALRRIDQRLASRRFGRKGGAAISAEVKAGLRTRGYAVIVYTPQEFLELVEDLDLPDFESSEWLSEHRETLEQFLRDQFGVFFRKSLSRRASGDAEPNN